MSVLTCIPADLLDSLSFSRCLDKAEQAQRPPAPQIPECPICGKPFLTLKSRASHLKQCAVKMQVGPQLLLQAVRLQTAQPEAGGPPPSARWVTCEQGCVFTFPHPLLSYSVDLTSV